MIFASHVFLFWFLPVVLGLYYVLPARGRSAFLVLASYVFYGWWRIDFLLPLLASTCLDFWCGKLLDQSRDRPRRRKGILVLSVAANLGLLGYFKYMNFGLDTLDGLVRALGGSGLPWHFRIVLPVGISFYTFQSMSYTLDIYRGAARPVRSFLDFACYVTLFPQLVCGPIVRYQFLEEQLRRREHSLRRFSDGVFLFQVGLVKKLLLADTVAGVANSAFQVGAPSCLEAWLGTLAYTFQIYFDFSGYSDMAIGLGLMLGFVFPVNFDSPYKAGSVTEFWRRWHMTLSSWLRDYLYIPLGGNRRGPLRTYRNLVITFLLCGLWHGAAWTFIAWGAYHGFWLIAERVRESRGLFPGLPRPARMLVTFLIVVVGWVFFRAESLGQAGNFLEAMVGLGDAGHGSLQAFGVSRLQWGGLVLCALLAFLPRNSQELLQSMPSWSAWATPLFFTLSVLHLFFQSYAPFLYFRF